MSRLYLSKIKGLSNDQIELEEYKHKVLYFSLNDIPLNPKEDITKDDIKNKKLYRSKNITLPNVKLGNLKDNYNVSIIRDYTQADYLIINNNIRKYHYDILNRVYKALDIKKYFQINSEIIHKESVKSILQIPDDAYIDIRFNWNFRDQSFTGYLSSLNTYKPFVVKDSDYDFLNYCLNADNLITDKDLLNIINDDNYKINEENFDDLIKMISSQNKDDVMIGLQMISNSNYKESFAILAYIFYFYSRRMYDIVPISFWNSVNIKAVREYFKTYIDKYQNTYTSTSYYHDYLIKALIKDKALTPFILEKVKQKLFNDVILRIFNDGSVFIVEKDDIHLKKHIVDNTGLPF